MSPQNLSPFERDSFFIADLTLCELRLFDQADLVWLILVPKRDNIIELIDLDIHDQAQLWQEIRFISQLLKNNFPCDKLNVAALGNVVPQLHVHVIARRFQDPYFPKPPFGVPKVAYGLAEKTQLIQKIGTLLHETPVGR